MKGVQRRVKWWLWAIEVCTTNLLPVSFSFACHHLNRRKLTEICCNIFPYQVFSTNIFYFYTISKLESQSRFRLSQNILYKLFYRYHLWTFLELIVFLDNYLKSVVICVLFFTQQNFATNDSKILVNYRGFAWNRTHVHCIQNLTLRHEMVLFCSSKYRHFRP